MKSKLVSAALATSLLLGSGCTVTVPFGSGSPPSESYKHKPNSTEIRPHTTSEKAWLAGMAVCQWADYYTTKKGLERGLEEINPVFGKNPSNERIRNAKILAVLLFAAGGYFDQEKRETIYQIGAGFGCGAALWNYHQAEKYGEDN